MNETALELNLINALGRLQHLVLDKEFVSNRDSISPELVPEQHFAFTIGQYHFVVHASFFCAVFIETPIAAVPNSPEVLVGLSNIRGALTPVYQLHTSVSSRQPMKQIIFSVGKAEQSVGLLIDALPVSMSLCAQEKMKNETQTDAPILMSLAKNVCFTDGKVWYVLNGETLGSQLFGIASQNKKQNQMVAEKLVSGVSGSV